jgi:uncharacterized protein (DUF697 family)
MAEKKDFVVNVKDETRGTQEPDEVPGDTKKVAPVKHVKKYMWWSMGAGLIPIPLLDLGVVAGVQLKMLHGLSQHYDVKFKENAGKSIIAALTGTLTADALRGSTLTSFIKSIPLVGVIGSVSMPIYTGAITYAIGKVFIQHFESGGTFLDFDPQKVKDYFAKLYEDGKKVATNLKAEKVM